MNRISTRLKLIAATGLVLSGCASFDNASMPAGPMPVAKIDNGLGDLPPYREWLDPTGRAPMGPLVTASYSARPR
ncbi:MAG: hypothetical protein HS128_15405 [Ideonella sp.]|nr:hypothetical protein [Ideonella sp.]MCC7457466.1 hypothetical protein [Nitrospira sp.]